MYNIEFYEKPDGSSDVWDFLEDLHKKAETSKDARIQLKQIRLHIQLLADNGTRLPDNITKHLEGDIWELRPGNNRVLYFYFTNNTFFYSITSGRKPQKRQELKLTGHIEKLRIT